jgi:DNA-binding MarR family transcriptional regulator
MSEMALHPMPAFVPRAIKHYSALLHGVRPIAARHNITAEMALVVAAFGKKQMTAGEVVLYGSYAGTNPSQVLRSLQYRGFLTEIPSRYDKRRKPYILSDAGLAAADEFRQALARINIKEDA